MAEKLTYPGRDLEAMNFAHAYHRWIVGEFKPFIGKRIVEVGAGSGSFSKMLLETQPDVFIGVEPAAEMYPLLRKVLAEEIRSSTHSYRDFFAEVQDEIKKKFHPDTIVYVNVLEHIEDDELEMQLAHETLSAGGAALIFVPALPSLYGRLDARIGHFRRYTKRELERKVRQAGFEVVYSRYFDIAGIIPWWVKFKLLQSSSIEPGAVKLYDGLVVPIMRVLELIIKPPIGKNLLVMAKKR